MRILGLSGSLRQGSYNTGLLTALADRLPEGVELVIFDGLRELPFYDPALDDGAAPDVATRLRQAITDADALLLSTPEYNGSIPAVIKNAIDWASRPAGQGAIKGKVTAVIGASNGQFGGIWAQDELRKSAKIAGARAVDKGVAIPKIDGLVDEHGVLTSEIWLGRLDDVVSALRAEVDHE